MKHWLNPLLVARKDQVKKASLLLLIDFSIESFSIRYKSSNIIINLSIDRNQSNQRRSVGQHQRVAAAAAALPIRMEEEKEVEEESGTSGVITEPPPPIHHRMAPTNGFDFDWFDFERFCKQTLIESALSVLSLY